MVIIKILKRIGKIVIRSALFLFILTLPSYLLSASFMSRLDEFAKNILSGGPPKDGIPPIDKPKYVSVQKAEDFLKSDDIVFLAEYWDTIMVFPQKILVWHEIVNDEIRGEKISITYCPLTGSVIGFKGRIDGFETTFGTSGKLLNSNLVMYDRATDSRFPQIPGAAVSGKETGRQGGPGKALP